MSGVIAGRHVKAPRRQVRRWPAYALTVVVLAALLAGLVAAVAHRGPAADGPPTVPASGVDDGNIDDVPANGRPAPAPEGALVPEVRQHIDGLHPRGLDHADTLRARVEASVEHARRARGGSPSPR